MRKYLTQGKRDSEKISLYSGHTRVKCTQLGTASMVAAVVTVAMLLGRKYID